MYLVIGVYLSLTVKGPVRGRWSGKNRHTQIDKDQGMLLKEIFKSPLLNHPEFLCKNLAVILLFVSTRIAQNGKKDFTS